jgi:hypothetical protein
MLFLLSSKGVSPPSLSRSTGKRQTTNLTFFICLKQQQLKKNMMKAHLVFLGNRVTMAWSGKKIRNEMTLAETIDAANVTRLVSQVYERRTQVVRFFKSN